FHVTGVQTCALPISVRPRPGGGGNRSSGAGSLTVSAVSPRLIGFGPDLGTWPRLRCPEGPFCMSSLRLHLLAAVLVLAAPLAARAQQAGEPGIPAASAAARIQPGDQVSLRIWNEPEMSDTFHVAETGEVVLPKLGVVRVTDLSASAARDSLQRAYAEFLRNPSVEVTVLRRVGVQGDVRKPDLYLVDLTMTLRDVIARAGGITEYGNPRRIEIVRGGERIPIGEGEGSR